MPITSSKLEAFYDPKDEKEKCGFILKGNRIVEVLNTHIDPKKGFEISPESIVKYEDNLKATWHTHPFKTNVLSEHDYACFLNWPHLEHYIIGTNGVQRYIVEDGIVLNAD